MANSAEEELVFLYGGRIRWLLSVSTASLCSQNSSLSLGASMDNLIILWRIRWLLNEHA